jgi:type II secretory pathway pseudopilin PulG
MKMSGYRLRGNRGQTIVEAIVVIAVVVLLVTGLIAGTTTSLKSARNGRVRSQATKLAQEGLEIVRSIRDESWSVFAGNSGYYCLGSDEILTANVTETCAINIETTESSYSRLIQFEWLGNKMQVTARVSYLDGTDNRNVTLTTYYTQWR